MLSERTSRDTPVLFSAAIYQYSNVLRIQTPTYHRTFFLRVLTQCLNPGFNNVTICSFHNDGSFLFRFFEYQHEGKNVCLHSLSCFHDFMCAFKPLNPIMEPFQVAFNNYMTQSRVTQNVAQR